MWFPWYKCLYWDLGIYRKLVDFILIIRALCIRGTPLTYKYPLYPKHPLVQVHCSWNFLMFSPGLTAPVLVSPTLYTHLRVPAWSCLSPQNGSRNHISRLSCIDILQYLDTSLILTLNHKYSYSYVLSLRTDYNFFEVSRKTQYFSCLLSCIPWFDICLLRTYFVPHPIPGWRGLLCFDIVNPKQIFVDK